MKQGIVVKRIIKGTYPTHSSLFYLDNQCQYVQNPPHYFIFEQNDRNEWRFTKYIDYAGNIYNSGELLNYGRVITIANEILKYIKNCKNYKNNVNK